MIKVKDLIKQAESTFGPVDILVNNAGYFGFTLLKNVLEDDWDKMIDVNCKVSFLFRFVCLFGKYCHLYYWSITNTFFILYIQGVQECSIPQNAKF